MAAYKAIAPLLLLGVLAACGHQPKPEAPQLHEFEGVPMTVRLQRRPDDSISVQVRETSVRSGTDEIEDLHLYGRAAASRLANVCGNLLTPQLVSESSKQGQAGRDYLFKCAPARLDRNRPQDLRPQQ